ncbi:glycine betaine--corrinoid protein methyltransferase [Clostridium sediminicola]|uniref:trimethylamine methyltransferase family protein n=1 Tax=Clostridium sediminicola TaxID=3114879 RepID=UPI0031F1EE68
MKLINNFLDKVEVEKIHSMTLRILSEVGVEIDCDDIVELFKKHGAKTEGNKVFIHEELFDKAMSTIPKEFELYGRRGSITVGGDSKIIAPVSGPLMVMEGNETRSNTAEDFVKFQKLHHSSTVMDVMNPNLIEPQDIDRENVRNYQMAVCLKYSDKPMIGFTTSPKASIDSINMAQEFYGCKENVVLGIISVISPLKYDGVMLEATKIYAEKNQPLMFACCSSPGATSPTTLSGTVAVNNAEVLAGIVISQLLRPGLPVLYGNTTGSCDMRFVSPAIGSVETGLIIYAAAAMAKYYGIPCRTGGSLSDAKAVDWQAGVESTITMLPALMSTSNFILQSCGVMDSFNIISYEKFILDEQNIEMFLRMTKGFEVLDTEEEFELVKEVGPGGAYIEEMHTFENFRNEHYTPKMFNKEGYEVWQNHGGLSVLEKASLEVKRRLEEHVYVENTPEQEEVLNRYLGGYEIN